MDSSQVGGLGGTYGGNPIACAAALAAIETYEHDDLATRARELGAILERRLNELKASDARVGDVRGRGAMMAMELVNPQTGEPDAALTARVQAAALAEGVVVLTCGTWGNVIRFLPPLAISDELLNEGLDVVGKAMTEC
jgi:4-aminobutyrate aminotransferase/(S)-3-amino-2-methylpropionate transaminase